MGKRWIAINLALLAIAGVLAWRLQVAGIRFTSQNNLAKIQPIQDIKQKLAQERGLAQPAPPKPYNSADFLNIPDQNVFSDTRAREEKTEVAPAAPVVAELVNKPVLVGVIFFGNQRLAAIIDPTVQGAGRKTQTKRVGDVYQGFTITDITENRMILEAGSRREIIPLHDGSKHQAQTGKTAILATRIVTFGGGTTGGSPVAGGAPSAKPNATPGVSGIGAGSGTAVGASGARITPQPVRQGSTSTPQPAVGPQAPANPPAGSRIIRTPFGDIVRPDAGPNQ